jgi:SecD/SecF fusion protein
VIKWLRPIYSFHYMSHKRWWFALSGVIICAGLLSIFIRGGGNPVDGFNFGLEFTSGTRISVQFMKPASVGAVRTIVSGQGIGTSVVQQTSASGGAKSAFQIQTKALSSTQIESLRNALNKAFVVADSGSAFSPQTVTATFGKDIITASYKAAILALVLVLIYVSIRFEWKFAVGAMAAEVHDLLVVVGVYSLSGRQVTTASIAAVLTILGYSLYDTVIVFDRIRENAPRMRAVRYGDMVDRSIWETLTRSINTTLTVLLPVICLLAFGGSTLKDFAFALLVGILSGAYSSIFIASPVATLLKEREPQHRRVIAKTTKPAKA